MQSTIASLCFAWLVVPASSMNLRARGPLDTPDMSPYNPVEVLCGLGKDKDGKPKVQPWCKKWTQCIKSKATPANTAEAVKKAWAPADCKEICGLWPAMSKPEAVEKLTSTAPPTTTPKPTMPAEEECAGLSGTSCKSVSGWHATMSLNAGDASKMCVTKVAQTSGTSCNSWCKKSGLDCLRAQDNKGSGCDLDGNHQRKSTANNGCDQTWGNQLCQCGKKAAKPAAIPETAALTPAAIPEKATLTLFQNATSEGNCVKSCTNFQESLSSCVATIMFEPGKTAAMGLPKTGPAPPALCTKKDSPCQPGLEVKHQKCLGHKTKAALDHRYKVPDQVSQDCKMIEMNLDECKACPQMKSNYGSQYTTFVGGCMDQLNAYWQATHPQAGKSAISGASGCKVH